MSLIFEFSISKLGYMAIFMKICKIRNFNSSFRTFLANQGNSENKDEKYGKMNSIFKLFISNLGYVTVFMKVSEKKIDPFLKTFLSNQGKNENNDAKI